MESAVVVVDWALILAFVIERCTVCWTSLLLRDDAPMVLLWEMSGLPPMTWCGATRGTADGEKAPAVETSTRNSNGRRLMVTVWQMEMKLLLRSCVNDNKILLCHHNHCHCQKYIMTTRTKESGLRQSLVCILSHELVRPTRGSWLKYSRTPSYYTPQLNAQPAERTQIRHDHRPWTFAFVLLLALINRPSRPCSRHWAIHNGVIVLQSMNVKESVEYQESVISTAQIVWKSNASKTNWRTC